MAISKTLLQKQAGFIDAGHEIQVSQKTVANTGRTIDGPPVVVRVV